MSSVPRIVLSRSVPRVDLSACPRRSQAELAARGLLLPPKPGTLKPGTGAETTAAPEGSNQFPNSGGSVFNGKIEQFQTSQPATVASDVSEESRVRSDGGERQSVGAGAEAMVVAALDENSTLSECSEGHYVEVDWSVEVARVVRVRRLSRRLVFLDVEIMTVGDVNVRDMKHMEQQQEEQRRYERDSLAVSVNDVSCAVVDVSGTLEVALKHPTCPDVRANSRHAHVGRLVSLRGPLVDLQPTRAPINAANNEDAQVPATFRLPLFFAASLTPFPAAGSDKLTSAAAGVAATDGRAEGKCAEESGEEGRGSGNASAGASAGAGAGAGAGADALGWRIVAPGWGVWENLPGGGGDDGARKGEGEAEWPGEVHDGGGGAEGGEGGAEERKEWEGGGVGGKGGSEIGGMGGKGEWSKKQRSDEEHKPQTLKPSTRVSLLSPSSPPLPPESSPLLSSPTSPHLPTSPTLHLSALPPLPPSAPPLSSLCKHYLNSGHCSAAPFCARAHPPPALLPLLRLHWIAHRQHRRRHCCSQGKRDPHSAEGKRGKQVRAELFAAWLVGTFGRGRLMAECGGPGGSGEGEVGGERGDRLEGGGIGETGDGGGKGWGGGKGVLDVAGGRGALAFALEQRHGVQATVVDPRGVRLNKKQVRELMGVGRVGNGSCGKVGNGGVGLVGEGGRREEDGEKGEGEGGCRVPDSFVAAAGEAASISEEAVVGEATRPTESALIAAPVQEVEAPAPAASAATNAPPAAAASPAITPSSSHQSKKALRRAYLSGALWKPKSIQREFSAADPSWAASNFSCFVGLHPDEVTGDIVFAAARAKVPFAVVPCCVFPGRFSARRVAVGGQMKKVETHVDLVEYLSALCRYFGGSPKIDWLNFSGQNLVLYCIEYT
ncbi:unnamed protein product [Closterium sp. NIES-53]